MSKRTKKSSKTVYGTPTDSFNFLAKQDETFKRTLRRTSKILEGISVSDYYNEVTAMHSSRLVRSILVNDVLADQGRKIIEATIQNQSHRSRLVEIKVKLTRVSTTVTEAIDSCQNYLRHQYAVPLSKEGKTQADRNAILSRLFRKPNTVLSEIEGIWSVLDEIIEDLDQAGWALKRIADVVAMQHRDRSF